MAASSVITARRSGPPDRGTIARTAARTAPRGPGLAPVLALPLNDARTRDHRVGPGRVAVAPSPVHPGDVEPAGAPTLRLMAPPLRRRSGLGRRAIAMVAAALAVMVLLGAVRGALAEPAVPVAAGHVVLAPGETLWDVAVRSAPTGVDPREQLDVLRRLNGFGSATLDAWTVVLIPAP